MTVKEMLSASSGLNKVSNWIVPKRYFVTFMSLDHWFIFVRRPVHGWCQRWNNRKTGTMRRPGLKFFRT